MKLLKSVYEKLKEVCCDIPFETGGILGSRDGTIVDCFCPDLLPKFTEQPCCYKPDILYFNQCIQAWQAESIRFVGMYHTHFANVSSLSAADIIYIRQILEAMPEEISLLYFPILTLPALELIPYAAKKEGYQIIPVALEVIEKLSFPL